jgi:hypothetical protein
MSAKEVALQVIQNLSDDATLPAIVRALQEAQATAEALRRFDERGEIPDEDVTDDEWRAIISRSFAEDLNDPRQDIYSEENGKSLDETR